MKCMIVLICFLFLTGFRSVPPESLERYGPPQRFMAKHEIVARAGVAAFNVVLGCLKGGIGTDMSFWSGCWRGALGGGVAYGGQHMASYVGRSAWAGGAGKLIQSAGVSMQDNVAENIGMFSRYQLDVGPVTFTIGSGQGFRLSYSLVSAAGLGAGLGSGGKLDLETSLKTLTPVYVVELSDTVAGLPLGGFCIGNTVILGSGFGKSTTALVLSHEFMHSLNWAHYRLAGNAFDLYGWGVGRDALYELRGLMQLKDNLYWWDPEELIAYTMERSL